MASENLRVISSMSLFKWNLFSGGAFKQAKYLVSTPQRAQDVIFISETGTISRDVLPMFTGWIEASNLKMNWLVLHPLKLSIRGKNGRLEDNQVLLISERSYIPLDPFKRLKKEKHSIASLNEIAKARHAEVRAHINEENSSTARDRMLNFVTMGCLIIVGLLGVLKIFVLK